MADRLPLSLFRIGADHYAVPAAAVIEVVRVPALTPLRQAPPYVIGMADLRGRVVPVLDLYLRLGRPTPPYSVEDALMVLAHPDGRRLALRISEAVAVAETDRDAIDPAPVFPSAAVPVLPEIVRLDGQLLPLLDLERLFALEALDLPPDEPEPLAEPALDFLAQFTPAERAELERRAAALRQGMAGGEADPRFVALLRLEGETMAVELSGVRAFARLLRVTRIPCCPDYILGSMNLRGEVMTAVDVRALLGMARGATDELRQAVVVALPAGPVAVAVHEIIDVLAVGADAFGAVPSSITPEQRRYCKGTVRASAAAPPGLLLDLAALLSEPELIIDEAV